jgi:hypothetical protein
MSGGSSSTGGTGSTSGGGAQGGRLGTGGSSALGGTTSGGATSPGASDPVIPPIQGTCPTLETGPATIAGLSGISLQVGPKKQGGPLLFYWHGTGSSAAEVNTLFPAAARKEILDQGGIIVSFQGSLGSGGDCSGTGIFSKDDFKVADLIAACSVRDHGIEKSTPRDAAPAGCRRAAWERCAPATSRPPYRIRAAS